MPNHSTALLHWYRLGFLGWEFRRQGSRWRFREEDFLDEVCLKGLAATIIHHAIEVRESSNTTFVESVLQSLDVTLALVSDDQVKNNIEQRATTFTSSQASAIDAGLGMATETARCILLSVLSESPSIPPTLDYQSLVIHADRLTVEEWTKQSVIDCEQRDESAELQLPDYVYDAGCRLLARSDLRLSVGEALKASYPQKLISNWANESLDDACREWKAYRIGDLVGWLTYQLWLASGHIAPSVIREAANEAISLLRQLFLLEAEDSSLQILTFSKPLSLPPDGTTQSVLHGLIQLDESIQEHLAPISSIEIESEGVDEAEAESEGDDEADSEGDGDDEREGDDEGETTSTCWRPPNQILNQLDRITPLTTEQLRNQGISKFIARSEPARRAATAALKFVKMTGPILIVAPSGSGKEMLVRDIHQIISAASTNMPDIPPIIICGELQSDTGWGDLVGVADKAATGVSAKNGKLMDSKGGVLVLDEFHSIPKVRQHDILRILDQDNPDFAVIGSRSPTRSKVECKIIACTSEDLWTMVDTDQLHKPLLLRFGSRIVWIPPLDERPEDIQGILEESLKHQGWQQLPSAGELEIVADFVVKRKWDGRTLKSELELRGDPPNQSLSKMFPEVANGLTNTETRKNELIATLAANQGNVTKSARSLYPGDEPADTKRNRLNRECKNLGIDPKEFRKKKQT